MSDLLYDLWFHSAKLPAEIKIQLLNLRMKTQEIWQFSMADYINYGVNITKADEVCSNRSLEKLKAVQEYIMKENIKYILYGDKDYPDTLKNIYNPPIGLFIKGDMPQVDKSIGIVGARNASQYGKTTAYKLAYELSTYNISVVSGMARGVDSSSHLGAIDGKGKTIAVMGSGFKNIYPKENKKLYESILQNGCVITEFFPDQMPLPLHFPLRNRIISALSKFVLVVEAGIKSGSLTTASLALEQGKDVFAVPGNIYSPNSTGTNKLIKDGAKPITCLQDILEEFGDITIDKIVQELDSSERKLLSILQNGAATLEFIIDNYEEDYNKVLSIVGKLECTGIIKRVYGNYYIIA